MQFELLTTDALLPDEECRPECLPAEESLSNNLKKTDGKSMKEVEQMWMEDNEEAHAKAEEYIEYIDNLKFDILRNEEDDNDDDI